MCRDMPKDGVTADRLRERLQRHMAEGKVEIVTDVRVQEAIRGALAKAAQRALADTVARVVERHDEICRDLIETATEFERAFNLGNGQEE